MAAFSDYLESTILNLTLRGQSYTPPSGIYIAVFTADPTDANTTAGELSDSAYVRQDAAQGGSVDTGWTAPADDGTGGKQSTNAKLIQFPAIADASVSISHYGLYDAQTGGNLLYHAAFTTTKDLAVNDVLSIDIGGLKVILK